MRSEDSAFGQMLRGWLFFMGKTETDLANDIGLSLNKLSAAIHGSYRLKRDYIERIAQTLELTGEDYEELVEAWTASTPQRKRRGASVPSAILLEEVMTAYRRRTAEPAPASLVAAMIWDVASYEAGYMSKERALSNLISASSDPADELFVDGGVDGEADEGAQ